MLSNGHAALYKNDWLIPWIGACKEFKTVAQCAFLVVTVLGYFPQINPEGICSLGGHSKNNPFDLTLQHTLHSILCKQYLQSGCFNFSLRFIGHELLFNYNLTIELTLLVNQNDVLYWGCPGVLAWDVRDLFVSFFSFLPSSHHCPWYFNRCLTNRLPKTHCWLIFLLSVCHMRMKWKHFHYDENALFTSYRQLISPVNVQENKKMNVPKGR